MRVLTEHFTSIHQMLDVTGKRRNNSVFNDTYHSRTGDKSFTMTKSWEEALHLFQYGYTDILDQIKTGMKENAKFQTPTMRRKMTTSVQGFIPHVPNAILGLPNSMIDIKSEVKKVKAISLVYSICENANINASEFVKSGISVLSTVHALELRGIRVNLKIMFYNAKHDIERALGTVDVKHFHEHLDLQKLCFPVAHPSMFRRIGFKWIETFPELKSKGWSWGYGSQMRSDEVLALKDIWKDNEYYLSLDITKKCQYDVDKIISRLKLK